MILKISEEQTTASKNNILTRNVSDSCPTENENVFIHAQQWYKFIKDMIKMVELLHKFMKELCIFMKHLINECSAVEK